MKIAVGDRVRALEDRWMLVEEDPFYYYRAGDTGTVVEIFHTGAWVKWDNNPHYDGVWFASAELLALIEEVE